MSALTSKADIDRSRAITVNSDKSPVILLGDFSAFNERKKYHRSLKSLSFLKALLSCGSQVRILPGSPAFQ
jgi:hypothetical protein